VKIDRERPKQVVRVCLLVAVCGLLSASWMAVAFLAEQHLASAGATYVRLSTEADPESTRGAIIEVEALRSDLSFNVIVGAIGLMAFAPLTVVLRRPWRWARRGAWIGAGVVSPLLAVAVAGSPDDRGTSDPAGAADAVNQAGHNLLAHWYPPVTAVLALMQFAGIAAVVVLLARSPASQFYAWRTRSGDDRHWTLPAPPH
jgi:hypothetical protein